MSIDKLESLDATIARHNRNASLYGRQRGTTSLFRENGRMIGATYDEDSVTISAWASHDDARQHVRLTREEFRDVLHAIGEVEEQRREGLRLTKRQRQIRALIDLIEMQEADER